MIADAATVGFEHPHGILLTLVKVGNTQPSEVKVGKRLVRTVKVGSHKTVEKAVVPVGELLFEGIGCAPEPIDKALSDFLNLGICHLDSMSVPYFNGLGLSRNLIRHLLALVDIGNGIVQGMLQEIDAVISGNSPKSHRNINKTALMDSLVTQLREYLLCGNLYTACHVCDSCIRSR